MCRYNCNCGNSSSHILKPSLASSVVAATFSASKVCYHQHTVSMVPSHAVSMVPSHPIYTMPSQSPHLPPPACRVQQRKHPSDYSEWKCLALTTSCWLCGRNSFPAIKDNIINSLNIQCTKTWQLTSTTAICTKSDPIKNNCIEQHQFHFSAKLLVVVLKWHCITSSCLPPNLAVH